MYDISYNDNKRIRLIQPGKILTILLFKTKENYLNWVAASSQTVGEKAITEY